MNTNPQISWHDRLAGSIKFSKRDYDLDKLAGQDISPGDTAN